MSLFYILALANYERSYMDLCRNCHRTNDMLCKQLAAPVGLRKSWYNVRQFWHLTFLCPTQIYVGTVIGPMTCYSNSTWLLEACIEAGIMWGSSTHHEFLSFREFRCWKLFQSQEGQYQQFGCSIPRQRIYEIVIKSSIAGLRLYRNYELCSVLIA